MGTTLELHKTSGEWTEDDIDAYQSFKRSVLAEYDIEPSPKNMWSTETFRKRLVERGDPYIWEQLYGSVVEWMETSQKWWENDVLLTDEQLTEFRTEFTRLAEKFAADPKEYPYSVTVQLIAITRFAKKDGYDLEISY